MNMSEQIKTYGLQQIIERLTPKEYVPFDYKLKVQGDDFRKVNIDPNKYIRPFLSQVSEYSPADFDSASIILIEAVGASGKSAMSEFLSTTLSCPIIDLGKTKVVASNSLTGLLTKRMQKGDYFAFTENVSSGKSTMIIDALDEGYLKTNLQGFYDFLDDVCSLEPQRNCPLIIMGRYNAIELAALYFFDKNMGDFLTLQIEPFTLQSARDFIDMSVASMSKIKYAVAYKDTRDYLLDTIGGFFKDQASVKDNASARFIGYAPVLQSIAKFFDERTNYANVLDQLRQSSTKSVALIVDIIERILKRDREEKVLPIICDNYLLGRSTDFVNEVKEKVYVNEEQCARILYKILGYNFPDIEIADPAFLSEYNKNINEWIDEHPFMGKNKPQNIVFESYILAVLVGSDKFKDAAFEYMDINGVSYMFTYIYSAIHKEQSIDKRLVPYLYESLRGLNNQQRYYSLSLDLQQKDNNNVICKLELASSIDDADSYSWEVSYAPTDCICLGEYLEYLNIDVPLVFEINKRKVDITAPSYIKCAKLIINTEEITIHKNKNINQSNFSIECEKLEIVSTRDNYLCLSGPGTCDDTFKIICSQKPGYPLFNHWISAEEKKNELGPDLYQKYNKLRSIIVEFRSHSKGELAKYQERIDFVCGNSEVGKSVISALCSSGVMYLDSPLYKLDSEKMANVLGVSYAGIKVYEINPTILKFLKEIK